jgi:hypothetical protein
LFVQPGDSANLGAAAKGTITLSNVERRGLAHEHLARKISTQATMLQTLFDDAALEEHTFSPARLSQLIAAAAAGAILKRIAGSTKAATHSRQLAPLTITVAHAITPFRLRRT